MQISAEKGKEQIKNTNFESKAITTNINYFLYMYK